MIDQIIDWDGRKPVVKDAAGNTLKLTMQAKSVRIRADHALRQITIEETLDSRE